MFLTRFDSVWESLSGARYYVESKFGTSGLTSAQRAAQTALTDNYHVERWSYPFFGNAAGAAGGLMAGAFGATSGRNCGCQR